MKLLIRIILIITSTLFLLSCSSKEKEKLEIVTKEKSEEIKTFIYYINYDDLKKKLHDKRIDKNDPFSDVNLADIRPSTLLEQAGVNNFENVTMVYDQNKNALQISAPESFHEKVSSLLEIKGKSAR